jgi:hypothetical protein
MRTAVLALIGATSAKAAADTLEDCQKDASKCDWKLCSPLFKTDADWKKDKAKNPNCDKFETAAGKC